MWQGSKRRDSVGASAAIVIFAACGKVTGVDDYRVVPPEPGAPSSIESWPECLKCFEKQCGTELQTCRANTTCSGYVDCKRGCADPPCHMNCGIDLFAAETPTRLRNDLYACASTRCTDACPFGRNFTCVGAYQLERPYATRDSIDVKVEVTTFPARAPAQSVLAQGCRTTTRFPCDVPLGQAATVVDGEVTLQVPSEPPYSGFTGVLVFSDERSDAGPADGGIADGPLMPSYFQLTLPFVERIQYGMDIPTRSLFDAWLALDHRSFDPKRAYVYVRSVDCGANPTVDVRLALSNDELDTKIYYWETAYSPSLALEATRGFGASVNFVRPDVASVLTAWDNKTNQVVSTTGVLVVGGAFTMLGMLPSPRED